MDTLSDILGQEIPPAPLFTRPLIEPPQESISPAAKIAKNMETYYRNPWAMVEDKCIFTLEETNLLNPIKPLLTISGFIQSQTFG